MIETLTHESFAPHVDTGFNISVDGHDEVLTLADVELGKPAEGGRRPFSLVFNGARTDALFHQQSLELRHPEMGALAIFIVPMGRNEDGTYRYQAVFT